MHIFTVLQLINEDDADADNVFVIDVGRTKDTSLAIEDAVDAHVPKQTEVRRDAAVLLVPDPAAAVSPCDAWKMLLEDGRRQVAFRRTA